MDKFLTEVDSMNLTREVQAYAKNLELDWIGFCPAERLDDAPPDRRPRIYLETVNSIISIGYRLNVTPIQNLPASRSAYMLEHDYANRHLDRAAQVIARFLEERGHKAVGFDAGAGFYHEAGKTPERFAGDFSHKHAAVACGLGRFGLNNLVLSPRWGPRIRLATILTNAELRYNNPLDENTCPAHECEKCVQICPVHALDGWETRYDPETGWQMNKRACYEYIFTTLRGQRCGLCIKACPVGLEKQGNG
jgi:epoxyqueuosine reductase QueG